MLRPTYYTDQGFSTKRQGYGELLVLLILKSLRGIALEFVDILNSMRFGQLSNAATQRLMKLNRLVTYDDGIAPTELYDTFGSCELSLTYLQVSDKKGG